MGWGRLDVPRESRGGEDVRLFGVPFTRSCIITDVPTPFNNFKGEL